MQFVDSSLGKVIIRDKKLKTKQKTVKKSNDQKNNILLWLPPDLTSTWKSLLERPTHR